MMQRWTTTMILDEIRHLVREEGCVPMLGSDPERERLRGAARRCFGSWANAVRAAGYEPLSKSEVSRTLAQRLHQSPRRWSRVGPRDEHGRLLPRGD